MHSIAETLDRKRIVYFGEERSCTFTLHVLFDKILPVWVTNMLKKIAVKQICYLFYWHEVGVSTCFYADKIRKNKIIVIIFKNVRFKVLIATEV